MAAMLYEDFRIPDKFVGLVIGRGGEQIKRMQQESGCKIRIESEGDGSNERSCRLSGTQESINEAKRMLSDVVQRGQTRENNGGSNGGSAGAGGFQSRGGAGGYQSRGRFQQQGGFQPQGGYQPQYGGYQQRN